MDAEVGIIGLGTMGSMAAWQLEKEGVSVIGFEQFGIGHDRSAAGGETRLFRTAYKEGAKYIPLLKDAYQMWKQLEVESGNSLFHETTGLIIGHPQLETMKNVLRSIQAFDLEHEVLSPGEAQKRFPQHVIGTDEIVIVDKKSGFLRPQYAIQSAVGTAEKLGAKIHSHTYVKAIVPDDEGVVIQTEEKEYKVKKLLITAGPWTAQFIPGIESSLEVRRLVNAWFLPRNKESFTEAHFPVFTRERNEDTYYGFPAVDGDMVKIGILSTKKHKIEHAGLLDKNVGVKELATLQEILRNEMPGLYNDPSRTSAYMEVYTDDYDPIVGEVPGHPNVVVLTGFSGHGFKMAPTMGKIAKELLMTGSSNFEIEDFSLERFLSGQKVKEE